MCRLNNAVASAQPGRMEKSGARAHRWIEIFVPAGSEETECTPGLTLSTSSSPSSSFSLHVCHDGEVALQQRPDFNTMTPIPTQPVDPPRYQGSVLWPNAAASGAAKRRRDASFRMSTSTAPRCLCPSTSNAIDARFLPSTVSSGTAIASASPNSIHAVLHK